MPHSSNSSRRRPDNDIGMLGRELLRELARMHTPMYVCPPDESVFFTHEMTRRLLDESISIETK